MIFFFIIYENLNKIINLMDFKVCVETASLISISSLGDQSFAPAEFLKRP